MTSLLLAFVFALFATLGFCIIFARQTYPHRFRNRRSGLDLLSDVPVF